MTTGLDLFKLLSFLQRHTLVKFLKCISRSQDKSSSFEDRQDNE